MVRGAAAGVEAPAFEDVYREHAGYVWRYLRRLGVAERHLEDLVHDVFIVVHRQLGTYDAARPIRPWLTGVAFRVGSEHRRRAHVRLEALDPEGEVGQRRPAGGVAGESEMINRERRRRLGQVLDALDFDKRSVFVMHEIEGYSIPEIDEITGVGVNTLYSRLRLARQEVRRSLEVVARRERRESA